MDSIMSDASSSNESTPALDFKLSHQVPARDNKDLNLLTLPLEIRWAIYDHLSPTSFHRTNNNSSGRRCFRLDWTKSSSTNPSSPAHGFGEIAPLAASCHQLRAEILPTLFRNTIVKFPAWNDDFKLQCLYWIESVSEQFVRGIDCFWVEGVYCRLCVRLGNHEGSWGEEEARRRDWRQFAGFVEDMGEGFRVRVEFFEGFRERAQGGLEGMGRVVAGIVEGREGMGLGRRELGGIVSGADMRGWDGRQRSW